MGAKEEDQTEETTTTTTEVEAETETEETTEAPVEETAANDPGLQADPADREAALEQGKADGLANHAAANGAGTAQE